MRKAHHDRESPAKAELVITHVASIHPQVTPDHCEWAGGPAYSTPGIPLHMYPKNSNFRFQDKNAIHCTIAKKR